MRFETSDEIDRESTTDNSTPSGEDQSALAQMVSELRTF